MGAPRVLLEQERAAHAFLDAGAGDGGAVRAHQHRAVRPQRLCQRGAAVVIGDQSRIVVDRNAVVKQRAHQVYGFQRVFAGGERGGVQAVIMDHAADVGAGAEDFEVDRIFAGHRALAGDLAPFHVDDDEIVGTGARPQRMPRQQEQFRIRQARTDVAEALDEAALVEEMPGLEQPADQFVRGVHGRLRGFSRRTSSALFPTASDPVRAAPSASACRWRSSADPRTARPAAGRARDR